MAKTMKTMDGNTAASYVSYAFTEVAAIYPITPSSTMAEIVDEWSAQNKHNIFGRPVEVHELQSEGGASGAVHGSLSAGALTTTYTASQGLLLMIPNMYKMSGELLPGVFHVSARALASHALSIFGDHQDVMATRQTGFAILSSSSVQEVMDLGGIAHLAAIKSSLPFLHFFDGFRTSHEIQKIELIDYEDFNKLVDHEAIKEFKNRALKPEAPYTKGTAQNPDIFFQAKEAANRFYEEVPDIVNEYMKKISDLTGRKYKPFDFYGAEDAENVIVAMGSVNETIKETVDYLVEKGHKVGLIEVRLYRPFSSKYFFDVVPSTVKKIAVLDRTKEPGAISEPLCLDIRNLYYDRKDSPIIVGGRYGLGSKDTTPSQIKAVFDNLESDEPKDNFTIGIIDDITNTSLEEKDHIITAPKGTIKCKFWGLGSDGTVGANKSAIKIIGDNTDMYAQAYFAYDSKKSGGITISHLRFGHSPIRSTYLVQEPDFVSCSNQAYVNQYDLLKGLRKGGKFLLNCTWSQDELDEKLPANMKRYIANNDIEFYTIDATNIANDIGLGNRINMVMQAGFFKLAEVIEIDKAVEYLKDAIVKAYGKKGEKVVNMNYEAVDKGIEALEKVNIPDEWKNAKDIEVEEIEEPDFIKNILRPINRQEGDDLPVSVFKGREAGEFPAGTAAYEKRGVAAFVPHWKIENCIQCNQCAFVCPHAAIRPFLLDEEERKNAPDSLKTKKAMGKGMDGLEYKIQISTYDCTGCGNCADICPAKEKALVMQKAEPEQRAEAGHWEYLVDNVTVKDSLMPRTSVKGSQFVQPLLEFSGACAGCGETPYIKVLTQLFGERMIIANATGCSSIWGGSAPSTPYTVNKDGLGPAWANSLFEDNAEYGYGMALAVKQKTSKIEADMKKIIDKNVSEELSSAFNEWIENKDDAEGSKEAAEKVKPLLNKTEGLDDDIKKILNEIKENEDYLVKKSIWLFGGDGWAYDIGYGGLDHVLASDEDINVFVLDTEVYSNTGGQSSKATPTAAIAKFASSGKRTKKKDLGLMAAQYGYVYVAQVAMGADKNQFLKAVIEAEKYKGPSIIIAYAPCIAHGIRAGMGKTQEQSKKAVDAGYWHLYRYNPELKNEGKNPFILDSKDPKDSFRDFIMGEVRYTSLMKTFPDIAEELFSKAENDAKEKLETYKKLAEQ
ncbi:MAG: pyruvate:ferredoxin (flavodoxin) oxidoreductase [Andreesenia angusta]|nr:pyruvate:ferredoxin (flavodoxin) oxidoreductase [Andreesenia angusta]